MSTFAAVKATWEDDIHLSRPEGLLESAATSCRDSCSLEAPGIGGRAISVFNRGGDETVRLVGIASRHTLTSAWLGIDAVIIGAVLSADTADAN